jgi:glycosyltransferase involved in cell wall biosynthesis
VSRDSLRIALLSPYHGGSHAAWGNGLARHSRHEFEVHSLPARFWKWRMHGAALTLADRLAETPPPDAMIATDMLDLSTFLGATRRTWGEVPAVLYMHENQVTYPLPEDGETGPMRRQAGERDRHYGFINLASMAVADRIVFNSEYHRTALFDALPAFLKHFPEERGLDRIDRLYERSCVIPVGIEVEDLPEADESPRRPLVVWNQRWEYDKDPAALFALLTAVADRGVDFEVALCGGQFGRRPPEFDAGIAALGDRVVHHGYLDRADYVALLGRARVVVSTAAHEFFGISVLEAAIAGAWPVLPRRLSYPELIPAGFAEGSLYDSPDHAAEMLAAALAPDDPTRPRARPLAADLSSRFGWQAVRAAYDSLLGETQRR